MKKLLFIFCSLIFAVSYCQKSDTESYELLLDQGNFDQNGTEAQPIGIQINVANTQSECSNNKTKVKNKTKVSQKQKIIQELLEKKLKEIEQQNREFYSNATKIAILALLIASSPPTLVTSILWKFLW